MAMPTVETGIVEEGRSALGATIASIVSVIKVILAYVMGIVSQLMKYAGEHPLAAMLTIANLAIWIA